MTSEPLYRGAARLVLVLAAFALTACSEEVVAQVQQDRAVVAADKEKLASAQASGDSTAIAASAKQLQWDQSTLVYDQTGAWQPFGERNYHDDHGGGGGHSHTP